MKVDVKNSKYREIPRVESEFSAEEIRHLRLLLRRLRFLETQIAASGGLSAASASGGAAFAEWEEAALGWTLTEIGYLQEQDSDK